MISFVLLDRRFTLGRNYLPLRTKISQSLNEDISDNLLVIPSKNHVSRVLPSAVMTWLSRISPASPKVKPLISSVYSAALVVVHSMIVSA